MTFVWWHVLIAVIPMLPNLWSIWDIWFHSFPTAEERMYWLLLVVFVPVIGGIIYILFGRNKTVPRI